MTLIYCVDCKQRWDGTAAPYCPTCTSKKWGGLPNLIKKKHDPNELPFPMKSFRSIVTEEVVERKNEFLEYAAASGQWFFHTVHQKYCVFSPDPLGTNPGSGVFKNDPWPSLAMDGLVVADPLNDAHIFAANQSDFRKDVLNGVLKHLELCTTFSCPNIAIPGTVFCREHTPYPKA